MNNYLMLKAYIPYIVPYIVAEHTTGEQLLAKSNITSPASKQANTSQEEQGLLLVSSKRLHTQARRKDTVKFDFQGIKYRYLDEVSKWHFSISDRH